MLAHKREVSSAKLSFNSSTLSPSRKLPNEPKTAMRLESETNPRREGGEGNFSSCGLTREEF